MTEASLSGPACFFRLPKEEQAARLATLADAADDPSILSLPENGQLGAILAGRLCTAEECNLTGLAVARLAPSYPDPAGAVLDLKFAVPQSCEIFWEVNPHES